MNKSVNTRGNQIENNPSIQIQELKGEKIYYGRADHLLEKSDFSHQLLALLTLSNERDKSVAIRSLDTLWSYYRYSMVSVLDWELIANTTCHPAEMVPSKLHLLWEEHAKIGEVSAVVVHPFHQNKKIGTQLFSKMHTDIALQEFDAIIGWTINPSMKHIWERHSYEKIAFPWKLYEEWLAFFEPLIGREVFEKNAHCGLFIHPKHEKAKEEKIRSALASL